MIDESEASPADGGSRRVAQRRGQRLTRARWPGRPNAPNSMGFLPIGTEWNDELTQGVLPSSSAMDTGSFGGPLATGTPPTVVVDLGEAPPVVGLARKASVGLGDGGNEGKGSDSLFSCG
jgi:hypothetical protein